MFFAIEAFLLHAPFVIYQWSFLNCFDRIKLLIAGNHEGTRKHAVMASLLMLFALSQLIVLPAWMSVITPVRYVFWLMLLLVQIGEEHVFFDYCDLIAVFFWGVSGYIFVAIFRSDVQKSLDEQKVVVETGFLLIEDNQVERRKGQRVAQASSRSLFDLLYTRIFISIAQLFDSFGWGNLANGVRWLDQRLLHLCLWIRSWIPVSSMTLLVWTVDILYCGYFIFSGVVLCTHPAALGIDAASRWVYVGGFFYLGMVRFFPAWVSKKMVGCVEGCFLHVNGVRSLWLIASGRWSSLTLLDLNLLIMLLDWMKLAAANARLLGHKLYLRMAFLASGCRLLFCMVPILGNCGFWDGVSFSRSRYLVKQKGQEPEGPARRRLGNFQLVSLHEPLEAPSSIVFSEDELARLAAYMRDHFMGTLNTASRAEQYVFLDRMVDEACEEDSLAAYEVYGTGRGSHCLWGERYPSTPEREQILGRFHLWAQAHLSRVDIRGVAKRYSTLLECIDVSGFPKVIHHLSDVKQFIKNKIRSRFSGNNWGNLCATLQSRSPLLNPNILASGSSPESAQQLMSLSKQFWWHQCAYLLKHVACDDGPSQVAANISPPESLKGAWRTFCVSFPELAACVLLLSEDHRHKFFHSLSEGRVEAMIFLMSSKTPLVAVDAREHIELTGSTLGWVMRGLTACVSGVLESLYAEASSYEMGEPKERMMPEDAIALWIDKEVRQFIQSAIIAPFKEELNSVFGVQQDGRDGIHCENQISNRYLTVIGFAEDRALADLRLGLYDISVLDNWYVINFFIARMHRQRDHLVSSLLWSLRREIALKTKEISQGAHKNIDFSFLSYIQEDLDVSVYDESPEALQRKIDEHYVVNLLLRFGYFFVEESYACDYEVLKTSFLFPKGIGHACHESIKGVIKGLLTSVLAIPHLIRRAVGSQVASVLAWPSVDGMAPRFRSSDHMRPQEVNDASSGDYKHAHDTRISGLQPEAFYGSALTPS